VPDYITNEERRLIDEALAADRVKKIPYGARSFAGYRWCEKTNRVVLIDYKPINTNFVKSKNTGRDTMNKNRAVAAAKRKETIRGLLASGKTKHEIANIMSLGYRTVNKLIKEIQDGTE
jgi:DNA-binding NarL/FixJ family response regulator